MPKEIDSLIVSGDEINLSRATCAQIDELLEFYANNPSNSNKARYSLRLKALIEDLINEELPELIAGNIKAGTIILSKIKDRKNNK